MFLSVSPTIDGRGYSLTAIRKLQLEQRTSTGLVLSLFASLPSPSSPTFPVASSLPSQLMAEAPKFSETPEQVTKHIDSPVHSEGTGSSAKKYANPQRSLRTSRGRSIWLGIGWYSYKSISYSSSTYDINPIAEQPERIIERRFLPAPFIRIKGFQFRSEQLSGNWKYTFTPVRVVPATAVIFEACTTGDVSWVIRCIQDREATIHDTTPDGYNLLHVNASPLYVSHPRLRISR
jgi:hypothetical protein